MNQIILTGCTGPIGHALIELLISHDIQVIGIVRPGSENNNNLPKSHFLQTYEWDLADLSHFPYSLPKCDAFCHLGWMGTDSLSRQNPEKQNQNVEIAVSAVSLAHKASCSLFLGIGSQAEYGNVSSIITETTPLCPTTAYGKAKKQAYLETRSLCDSLPMRHLWARFFNVYGPYSSTSTFLNQAISHLLQGESMSYTPGEQFLDFLYCKDAATALFLLLSGSLDQKAFCIGSPKAYPLKAYLSILHEEINPQIPVALGTMPYPENQNMLLFADPEPFYKTVSFIPQYSFAQGIQETAQWLKNATL